MSLISPYVKPAVPGSKNLTIYGPSEIFIENLVKLAGLGYTYVPSTASLGLVNKYIQMAPPSPEAKDAEVEVDAVMITEDVIELGSKDEDTDKSAEDAAKQGEPEPATVLDTPEAIDAAISNLGATTEVLLPGDGDEVKAEAKEAPAKPKPKAKSKSKAKPKGK